MGFQADFNRGHASVKGAEVTYYDSGSVLDKRDVIVLVHGTGGSAYGSFWALMPMLSFKYRVIALDLVDSRQEQTGISDYVDQCLGVMAATAPGKAVTLVGYSLGAAVAATLAFQAPAVVKDLVLVAGWLKTDPHQLLRNSLWFGLRDAAPELLPQFTVLTSYSHRFLTSKTEAEIQTLKQAAADGPDRGIKMQINQRVDLSGIAAEISNRTLVIGCTEDQMVPISHAHALYAAIPNSTFVDIRSGHLVVHERPAELFKRIHDFVSRNSVHLDGTILSPIHA